MGFTVEIAADAAASSWTDITSVIDRLSVRMGGQAYNGEVGSGFGFDLDDLAASRTLPARRVLRMTIGSTVVGRGRIATKGVGRGTMPYGDSRSFDVEAGDANSHLYGIIVDGWKRPAETDVTRVRALVTAFLAGTPRASTNLGTLFIATGDPVSLPAKRYDDTDPNGVLADINRITGKIYFVTVDEDLFYDAPDSTAYAAGLLVTDDAPNLVDEFPPIFEGQAATQDGTELVTGGKLKYGSGRSVTDTRSAAETAHDHWRETFSSEATSADEANRELDGILDNNSIEEERFPFAIELTEDQIDLIKYGQTLTYRAAASGVLVDRVIRAARIEYEWVGDERWLVHIEGGFPEKLEPRLRRGKRHDASATVPALDPVSCAPWESWPIDSSGSAYGWFVTDEPDDPTAVDDYGVASSSLFLRGLPQSPFFPRVVAFNRVLSTGARDALAGDFAFDFSVDLEDISDQPSGAIVSAGAGVNGMAVNWAFSLEVGQQRGNDIDVPDTSWIQLISSGGSDSADLGAFGHIVETVHCDVTGTGVTCQVGAVSVSVPWTKDLAAFPPRDVSAALTDTSEDGKLVQVGAIDFGGFAGSTPPWCTTWSLDDLPVAGVRVARTLVAMGNGVTAQFSVPFGYRPGTLAVYVDGIWQPITEVDPEAGTFELGWIPADGDKISAEWEQA